MKRLNPDYPAYLQMDEPELIKSLTIDESSINIEKGTFKGKIVFDDPTDDLHVRDENGCVLKEGSITGTFGWTEGLSVEDANEEDDLYPDLDWISFGGLSISDDLYMDAQDTIEAALPSPSNDTIDAFKDRMKQDRQQDKEADEEILS